MHSEQQNIYKTARLGAGLTQEAAAEVLALSVESVRAYETGRTTPPAETVVLMADAYGAEWLRVAHAAEHDVLGVMPQGFRPQPFPLVTIQLYDHLREFAEKHRAQQLLKIAADGVIDESERPLLDEIVCELEGISAALLALKCAKKERPTAATVKRSSSRGESSENHCKEIIPQSFAPCKPQFANAGRCAG